MRRLTLLLALTLPAAAKDYTLCFLTSGPTPVARERAKDLQSQHMAHINKMWEAGVLESAGPVGKLEGARGIFVFATDMPTAKKWTSQDPKVIAGDLALDCHPWQGPDNVGANYRTAYAKPGFVEKMGSYVAVFSLEPLAKPVLAQGPVTHPKWKYFSVLPLQKLTDFTAGGDTHAFIWMHDPQVWP